MVDGVRLARRRRARIARSAEGLGASLCLDPQRSGFTEAVLVQEGLVGGGMFLAGLDAGLGAVGGLGSFAVRVQPPEVHALLHDRKLAVVVPPVAQVSLRGREPRSCSAVEVALELHARAAAAGLPPGVVLELTGEWIAARPVPERLALCGALARLGRAAIVPPDKATEVFLSARRPGAGKGLPASAPDPTPEPDLELDVAKVPLSCLIEVPDGERLRLSGEVRGPEVDEVLLAGGIEELRAAAEVLGERRLHPGLLLSVVPSDRRSLLHALDEGLLGGLLRIGAQLLPPGQLPSPLRRGERRVVTRPTGTGDIFCGPAVAAAAAVVGAPVDPEHMRRSSARSSTPA